MTKYCKIYRNAVIITNVGVSVLESNRKRGFVMNEFMSFISAAIVIEGVISYVSEIAAKGKISWKVVGSIAIGLVLAFNLHLDFFALLGLQESTYIIGTICTGILISRGSNYVYELYDRFMKLGSGKAVDDGARD